MNGFALLNTILSPARRERNTSGSFRLSQLKDLVHIFFAGGGAVCEIEMVAASSGMYISHGIGSSYIPNFAGEVGMAITICKYSRRAISPGM